MAATPGIVDNDTAPRYTSADITGSTLQTPTAVVHLEYDAQNPPPTPGPNWTRFICISDTHCRQFQVPTGDVLLHGGDLTNTGTYTDIVRTVDWLKSLPHKKKIIIAGNHDIALDQHDGWYDTNFGRWHRQGKENIEDILEVLKGSSAQEANIVYLQDELYQFSIKEGGNTWSVYGSPWSPEFHNWAFNYARDTKAEDIISAIPQVDILLTHGPPYHIFDKTYSNEDVGCEHLAARLPILRPRLHLFGHIHEDHGAAIHEWSSFQDAAAVASSQDASAVTSAAAAGSRDRTVFVNGANFPMGKRAWLPNGPRVPFGSGPFAPVIVDLLDRAQ